MCGILPYNASFYRIGEFVKTVYMENCHRIEERFDVYFMAGNWQKNISSEIEKYYESIPFKQSLLFARLSYGHCLRLVVAKPQLAVVISRN